MKLKLSLRRRIVLGFSIQTLLICFIAFISITSYVDYIEESVLYDYFSRYLDAYVDDREHHRVPAIPEGIRIFESGEEALPAFARELPEGGQEVMLDNGQAYHVFNKSVDGIDFTLVADQTEFEHMEITVNHLTLAVMLLFTLVSVMFSLTLANRIVQPIKELSERASNLNVNNIKQVDLDYSDDEVGSLVRIIYEQIATLGYYLQREKWFTGDISHELRTPMMVISSSVDLLKQSALSEQQRTDVYQRIEGAIAQVNELIDTFLLLARDKSSQQTSVSNTDLVALAESVMENLLDYAGERNNRVSINPQQPVFAEINPAFLDVVLSNLLKNALFNTRDGEIQVNIQASGIKVSDSGKGLTDFIKRYVNDLEVTDHRENGHLGLGLSIVKRVCEKENWTLTAYDSTLGGASFLVSFNQSRVDHSVDS